MTQVTVSMPETLLNTIAQLSRNGYRSRNQQIVMMLETYVQQAETIARQSARPQLLAAEPRPAYAPELKKEA